MILSGLDFVLISSLMYVSGIGTGLLICCKYRDKLVVRSRSRDNLSHMSQIATPVVSSAPAQAVTKITLE